MSEITKAVRDELALLTPEQVCELLQVTKPWLYDQVEQNDFPSVRLSHRHLRFRASEVSAWIAGERPRAVEPISTKSRRGRPRKA